MAISDVALDGEPSDVALDGEPYDVDPEMDMAEIKDLTKKIITLCTEREEAELLEVYTIAFKMLCEK